MSAPVDRSKFKIDVLNVTQTSQIQNGLRLNDYTGYRHYCTRKINKLRKQLKVAYGKKAAATKITDPKTQINDIRYLQITLYKTERAWAYAMDLKNQYEQGETSRAGFHMSRRFTKAAKYSAELEAYCRELSDAYTILEAQAYAAYLKSSVLIVKEQWSEALEAISITKYIYNGLCESGDSSQKDIYLKRLEEIQPIIRFCAFHLRIDQAKADSVLKPEQTSPMSSLLSEVSKMDKKESDSISITWKSKSIRVENDRLKEKLNSFEQLRKEKESSLPKSIKSVNPLDCSQYVQVYEKLASTLNESEVLLKNEISSITRVNAKNKTVKSEIEEINLKIILSYVLYHKMKYLYERNQITIMMFKRNLNGEEFDLKAVKGKKRCTWKDLVTKSTHQIKIFSTLVENQDSSTVSVMQNKDNDSQLLLLRSYRLYYIAVVATQEKKFSVTMGIMEKIQSNLNTIKKQSSKNSALIAELNELETQMNLQRSMIHANSFIEQMNQNEELKSQMSSLTLSGGAGKSKDLLSGLESFDTSFLEEKKLVEFPPKLDEVPVKPLFFDLAFNSVQFPSLEQRKKPAPKGLFGSFWGR